EVYRYAANRVSQLFVSTAEQDLAGVAHDVKGVVKRLPFTYALDHLPADRKEALFGDREFLVKLRDYVELSKRKDRERDRPRKKELQNEFRQQGESLRRQYGIEPEKLLLPRGIRFEMRGEVESMEQSFGDMAFSLVLAVLLVYLVMAAQFSSWLDP